jgi:lantibiotic biosynthesis protein
MQSIDDILNSIAENLYKTFKNKNDKTYKEIGIISGMSSIALFYAYYQKYNIKSELIYPEIIEEIIEIINNKNDVVFENYCDGITGFAWLLEHLVQHDFINADDIDEIIDDLDEVITTHLNKEIKDLNFDFLYGVMGIGNYFLLRNNRKDCSGQIDSILNALIKSAVKDKIGIKWKSNFDTNSFRYNYGFAHGQVSIIAFLNKLIKNKYLYSSDVTLCLLKPAIDHLLTKELYLGAKNSNRFILYESNEIKTNEKASEKSLTMGWCYGDLTIAWTLLNSAKLLNDRKLEEKVSDIMLTSSERRDLNLNYILDAHFCHGASSIFHMFYKYKQVNNNELYKETVDYWLNQMLDMLYHKNGIAGYKHYNKINGKWENQYYLLTGVSGVGLTLLSYLKPELLTWDECLLIS